VVSWSKDGGRLPASAIERDGELTLSRASASDSGTYTCTASNQGEVAYAEVYIRVTQAVRPTRPPSK